MSMAEYIPAGFSPLANWDFRERQKQDGHSADWKSLSDAVKSGDVPGFKLPNGRWYVHEDKANAFLAKAAESITDPVNKFAAPAAADGIDKRHAESVCESLASIDSTLDEIYRVFERLTTAVESIATQPKAEPAGTWRDMNGESL